MNKKAKAMNYTLGASALALPFWAFVHSSHAAMAEPEFIP